MQLLIILQIFFLFLQKFYFVNGKCGLGCDTCNNQLQCMTCFANYELDVSQNKCIYNKCEEELYFQVDHLTNQSQVNQTVGSCQAICDNEYYHNKQQNICVKLEQCSLQYSSQYIINRGDQVKDIIPYSNDFILVFYANYINQINRLNGKFEQTLDFTSDITQVIIISNQVIVLQSNMQIMLWDIEKGRKLLLTQIDKAENPSSIQLLKYQNIIGFSVNFLANQKSIIIQHIFSSDNPNLSIKSQPYQLTYGLNENILCFGNLILRVSQSQIIISEIILNNNKEIQVNIKQSLVCQQLISSSIKQIIQIDQNSFLMFQNQIKSILFIKNNECVEKQFDNQPLRIDQFSLNDLKISIIQFQQKIVLINSLSQQILFDKTYDNQIKDFRLSGINICILYSNQMVFQYSIKQTSNAVTLDQSYQINITIKNPTQLFIISTVQTINNTNKLIDRLYITGSEIQSTLFDIDQSDSALASLTEKPEYIIRNFEMKDEAVSGVISSLILLEATNTLVSCSLDGRILIWDISNFFEGIFLGSYQLNGQCNDLIKYSDEDVIAIFSNKIVIFNIFSLKTTKEWLFSSTLQVVKPMVSILDKQVILLFNSYLYVYQNTFANEKQLSFDDMSSDISNLFLQGDNYIIIQRTRKVQKYQIDNNLKLQSIKTIPFTSDLLLIRIKIYPESYQSISLTKFLIILYTRERELIFLNDDLSKNFSIPEIPISDVYDINFLRLDPSDNMFFIVGKTVLKTATYQYQGYAVEKGVDGFSLAFELSAVQKILEPYKYLDPIYGNSVYDLKAIQNLSYFTCISSFTYNPQTKANSYDEISYLQGLLGARFTSTFDKKYLATYDNIGFVGANIQRRQYYEQSYKLDDSEFKKGDQIVDIQQSYVLEKYFIIHRNVTIMNIHTNKKEGEIIFDFNANKNVKGFIILEQEKTVIAYKDNQIKVMNVVLKTLISYEDSLFIYGLYVSSLTNQKQIFVYGNKIMSFSLDLQIIQKEIYSSQDNQAQFCKFTSQNIICKLSNSNINIFDYSNLKTPTFQFQTKNLGENYQMIVDESNDRLFLFTDSIEVYSIKGTFKNIITQTTGLILNFYLYDKNIVFNSISTITVYDRQSFNLRGYFQPSGGGNLYKIMYIPEYNHLLVCGTVIRFAQIYIYSLDSLLMVTSIRNTYIQNGVRLVIDIKFDKNNNILAFLDEIGNILIIDYQGSYSQTNMLIIREFRSDLLTTPIAMSLDMNMNNLIVYNSNTIYSQNYSGLTNNYKKQQYVLNNYYVKIPQNSFSLDKNKEIFIFISSSNVLYVYDSYNFSYFAHLDSNDLIKGIQYIKNANLLVIASYREFKIFKIPSTSIGLGNNINTLNTYYASLFQFYQFLCDSIFITDDKKFIHFNFQTRKALYTIQLGLKQRIISSLYIESINVLICGFNDGTLLIYDINIQKESYEAINIENSNSNNIRYIQEDTNFIWVASLNSQVLKIKKSNLQTLSRYDMRYLSNSNYFDISVFAVDELNNRMIIGYFGEKQMKIIDLSDTSKINKILSFPNRIYNRIKILETIIVFYSKAQLNIHARNNLQFLIAIRRQNYLDEIIQFFSFQDQYFLIQFISKMEIFKVNYSTQDIKLIDQIKVLGLNIIKSVLDSYTNTLRVVGIQKNQIFDQTYSLSYFDQLQQNGYQSCSLNIKGQTYLEMTQTLSILKPLYQQLPTLLGLIVLPDSSTNKYFTIYINREDFAQINFQATGSSKLTITPLQDDDMKQNQIKNLIINQDTFQNFSKEDFILKNFNIIFTPASNQIIEQNIKTQNVFIQNITINNQNLVNIQIPFINKQKIIINKINISKLNISSSKKLPFFKFESCQFIEIISLQIDNLVLEGDFFSFINVNNTQKVIIYNLVLTNSRISNFIMFEMVQNLTIKEITVKDCSSYLQNMNKDIDLKFYLFQFTGVILIDIKNVIYGSNKDLLFSASYKKIQTSDITIIYNKDQYILYNATFISNTIQYSNQLSLLQLSTTIINFEKINFISNNANIQFNSNKQVQIKYSIFTNNVCINGGAISFIDTLEDINIINTTFTQNQAYGSGGAIYCQEINGGIFFDKISKIMNNRALIGGGIRIYNIVQKQQNSILKQLLKDKIIENNKAEMYGNDYATFLSYIQIKNIIEDPSGTKQAQLFEFIPKNKLTVQEQLKYGGKISLNDIRSGTSFSLQIQIYDGEGQLFSFEKDKFKNNKYPLLIEEELSQIYFNLENNDQSKFMISGESFITAEKFEQSSNSFYFKDFQITSIPQTSSTISFKFNINPFDSQYIAISMAYRRCVIGEIIKYYTSEIYSCSPCQIGSYSLSDPITTQNQNQQNYLNQKTGQNSNNRNQSADNNNTTSADQGTCQKCPDSAAFCQGKIILLKDGYWRSDDFSQEILECKNSPSKCKPEGQDSIQGCTEGSIGPLCEECDSFGELWKGKSYTRSITSNYDCVECSKLAYQITFIFLILVAILIYSLFSAVMFMASFKYTQTCYYLRLMSILPISRNSIKDQSSFYLKILLNYLQISQQIIQFNENLFPDFILTGIQVFQSPTYKIVTSIDCLSSLYSDKRTTKMRITLILYLFLPIIIFVLLIIILSVIQIKQKKQLKTNYKYTLLSFLFLLFQPSQVIFYTQSLSCRKIGTTDYKYLDLLLGCKNTSEDKFIIPFSVSMLMIWILVPFIFWNLLRKNSHQLQTCYTRYRFGYFYSEFKSQYYYWEFLRLSLRITVVVAYTLLKNDHINTAYNFIVIIISIYLKMILFFNPLFSNQLLKSEILSYQVILVNILLSVVNQEFEKENELIKTLIYVIHIVFLVYIISAFIFFKINSRMNLIGRIIRYILKQILSEKLYNRITRGNVVKFEVFQRWKKVKQNLVLIIGFCAIDKAKTLQTLKNPLMHSQQVSFNSYIFNNKQTGKTLQSDITALFQDMSKISNTQIAMSKILDKTNDDLIRKKQQSYQYRQNGYKDSPKILADKSASYDASNINKSQNKLITQSKASVLEIFEDTNEITDISICFKDVPNQDNISNEITNLQEMHRPSDNQKQYHFMKYTDVSACPSAKQ